MVLFKRRTKLIGIGGLGHLRERLINLLFGVVDILEGIKEQSAKVFRSHGILQTRGKCLFQHKLVRKVPAGWAKHPTSDAP